MRRILLLLLPHLYVMVLNGQSLTPDPEISQREKKWLERNGFYTSELPDVTDSVSLHLNAALKYHRTSGKLLKYGGIGVVAGIATIVVGETYLADPTWLYAGVITAYGGALTGIIGGSIADARAKHELGSAIALLSLPDSLQSQSIGFELEPTEYVWITKNGFNIYTYEWDDAEINRLLSKAVKGRRRSATIWRYGTYIMAAGVVATAIAVRERAYGVAYRIILPVYTVQLLTALGGPITKELAVSRARKAAQKRPLGNFVPPH